MSKIRDQYSNIEASVLLASFLYLVSIFLFSNIRIISGIDINNIAALLFVLSWMMYVYQNDFTFRFPMLFALLLTMIIYFAITITWSVASTDSIRRVFLLGYNFVIMVAAFDFYKNERRIENLIQISILPLIILPMTVLLGYSTHTFLGIDQSWWMNYDANLPISWHFPTITPEDSGVRIAYGTALAWYSYSMTRNDIVKYGSSIYLLLSPFALVLISSRQAFGAFFIAVAYIVFSYFITKEAVTFRDVRRIVYKISPILVVFAVAVPAVTFERVYRLELGYLGERVRIWTFIIELIRERPILGYGIGTQSYLLNPIDKNLPTTHNTYLTIVVETGLLGLAIYMSIVFSSVRQCLQTLSNRSLMWLTILLIWGFSSFFHGRSGDALLLFAIAMITADMANNPEPSPKRS